jgi:uncharacterized repeat protein (TIGR01451 family)
MCAFTCVMGVSTVRAQTGTCTGTYQPVSHTFTLNYGSKYLIAPPREPRIGGSQNITDAATLNAAILAACPSATGVEVERLIGLPPDGNVTLGDCYPTGATGINQSCWSSSNALDWRLREGVWLRVAGTGGSCTFTWYGCDFTANTTIAGNEYNAPRGYSVVAPPYLTYTPSTALNLINDLGGLPVTLNVQRYILATDGFEIYTGRKGSPNANFPTVEGEGYVARMSGGPAPDCTGFGGTVTGKVYRDLDSSGTFNTGDQPMSGRLILDSGSPRYGLSNSSGDYSVCAPLSFDLHPSAIFGQTFTPASIAGTIALNGTLSGQDFAKTPVHDLSTTSFTRRSAPGYPVSFCPNNPVDVCARFSNAGDFTEAGAELRLELPPTSDVTYGGTWTTSGSCTFVPSAPTLTTSPHRLTWSLAGIAMGQECAACATVNVASSVVLGQLLTTTASVYLDGATSLQDSVDPPHNTEATTRPAACSYDPNDMQVDPPGCGTIGGVPAGQKLEYTIRFQNVGNAPATNVLLRDVIAAELDLATFELVATSHSLTGLTLDGNRLLSFRFDGINLAPALSNDAASRGYAIFRIRPNAGLPLPTTFSNSANIVFDTNPPIFTNAVLNTVSGDADSDTVLDICDNCPAVVNLSQANADGDLLGDACDPDDDGDGALDGNDCAPLDVGAFAIPGEIGGVAFAADKLTLSWNSAAATSGTTTVHDLMSGTLGAFPVVAGSADHVCVAGGAGTSAQDPTVPAPGTGLYYLARGQNSCGSGTLGFSSAAIERTAADCP